MTVDERIWVFGAGGHGRVVADAAEAGGLLVEGFVDDSPERQAAGVWGRPVVSLDRWLSTVGRERGASLALGIGDNAVRERCFQRLKAHELRIATVIHSRAVVSRFSQLGEGTVVMAGAVINPDARCGPGGILNTGAVVEHDCELGGFVHLSPNAALGGNVTIGDRSHVGVGASVIPGIRIGRDVRVGAGAAVVRDVSNGQTVVGVPARPLRKEGSP